MHLDLPSKVPMSSVEDVYRQKKFGKNQKIKWGQNDDGQAKKNAFGTISFEEVIKTKEFEEKGQINW